MKNIKYLLIAFIIFGCKQSEKKEQVQLDESEGVENTIEKSKVPVITQNYAVVFKWATKDEKLVEANALQQADQLLALWKNNKVENVYYDSSAKVDKFSYFPNITFVIKAENLEAAEVILNNLIVVKKGIATYTTYPVGNLWLKRNTDKINKKGITKSFVSVWTTKSDPNDEITKAQNDAVLALWKNGTVENAYFDIEGIQKANNKTDFVLFINVDTEEEAQSILKELPFVKNDIASYQLHQVGVLWMGIHE